MKKYLFIVLTIVSVFALTACSSSSSSSTSEDIKTEKKNDIDGVWSNGKFFVSFNKNGYYTAFLNNKFIDSGNYIAKGNEITCKNNYNNKTTKYIISISGNKLNAIVTYKNFENKEVSENISFTKSTKNPSEKDHILVGKSYSFETAYYGTVTDKFETHNTAYHASNKSKSFKNVWYYIYLEPNIYYQKFTPTDRQYPTSTFMDDCDTGNVHINKITIDGLGNIDNMEYVKN
nr:MAG TPA: lipoprotein [Caudoviricetes sp.]